MIKDKSNILLGNKLIAEHLGYKYYPFQEVKNPNFAGWKKTDKEVLPKLHTEGPIGKRVWLCRRNTDLRFYNSWDWLMPACEKFEDQKKLTLKNSLIHKRYSRKISREIRAYNLPGAWTALVGGLLWIKSIKNGSR